MSAPQSLAAWAASTWGRLRDAPFLRSVATLVAGTAAARALTVLVSPLLTRLYSPEDFGVLAVYVGLVSIVAVGAGLCFDLAIPLPKDDEDAFSLLLLALTVAVGVSGVVTLALALGGDALLGALQADGLVPLWGAIPVGILAAAVYNALSYWAVRVRDYNRLARTKVSQGVGMALAQVGLGFAGAGPAGLVAGDVIGRSSGSATLGGLAFRAHALGGGRWRRFGALAGQYRRFPLFSMPASLLNTAGLYAPAIILSASYGAVTAGWFALAQRVAGLGVVFVGHAVGQAYMGEGTRLVREDPHRLKTLYDSSILRLSIVSTLIFVPLYFLAPLAFRMIFGPDWSESGEIVKVLTPMLFAQLIVSPVSQTLNIIQKQNISMAWEMVRMVLGIGFLMGAIYMSFDYKYSIGFYSIGMFVSYVIYLIISEWQLRRFRQFHST